MYKEIELKDNKSKISADKIEISDQKTKQETKQINLFENLNKTFRIIKGLDKTPKKHKRLTTKTATVLTKSFHKQSF